MRPTPYKTLDALRGIAALWVVMDHACAPWLGTNPSFFGNPLYAFSIHGAFGVVMFFLISGYCITAAAFGALMSGKPVRRYAFDRARRIYPPYWASLCLSVVVALILDFAQTHHIISLNHMHTLQPSFSFWVGNLLLLQSELKVDSVNIVFWSLCYEIAFYFIMGLFLFGARRLQLIKGNSAAISLFIVAVGLSTAASLSYMLAFNSAIFPFDLWHEFSIGALLFFLLECNSTTVEGYSKRHQILVWCSTAISIVLTVFFICFRQIGFVNIGHPSSKLTSSACLLFGCFLFCLRPYDEKVSRHHLLRPLLWLGAFSYSLYITHSIVIPFIDVLCRKVYLDGNRYWITFCLQIIVAIGFGNLFYLLIERRFISKRQVSRLASEHIA